MNQSETSVKRSSAIRSVAPHPIAITPDLPVGLGVRPFLMPRHRLHEMHMHAYLEIGYCYEGCGVMVVHDQAVEFSPGIVVVINPGVAHGGYSVSMEPMVCQFLFIDPWTLAVGLDDASVIETVTSAQLTARPSYSHIEYPEVTSLLQMIIAELQQQPPGYRITIMNLARALLVYIARGVPTEAKSRKFHHIPDHRDIAPALDYIVRHYQETISIKELAPLCGMSPLRMRRLFHKVFGKSPQEYLTSLRVKTATVLLHISDRNITDIALEVGYSSSTTFAQHFRRMMGMSPRTWRKMATADPC